MPPLKVMLAIISDQSLALDIVQLIHQETTYMVLVVEDSLQAQEVIKEIVPDFLLLDYSLQGIDGITLYIHMHTMRGLREIPALIINTPMLQEIVWSANRKVMCLNASFTPDELLSSIETLAASHHFESAITFDTEHLETPFSKKWTKDVR